MREQQYYDQLLVDNRVTAAAERDMLQAFVASIGAERGLCEYARVYLAAQRHNPTRERTHSAGGEWSYPDSFPPNFQDR